MKSAELITHLEYVGNVYKILVGKPERERQIRRPRLTW